LISINLEKLELLSSAKDSSESSNKELRLEKLIDTQIINEKIFALNKKNIKLSSDLKKIKTSLSISESDKERLQKKVNDLNNELNVLNIKFNNQIVGV
jgi:SMC interacting uncharacterized protein involved in chromosome segregation